MNCARSDTPSPPKTMGLNSPLATLWNGLKKLESQHQEKKEKLLALLRVKKAISKEDQNWLDGAANLVDEVCILEALEKAPDYKTGLGKLSPSDWMVVEALKKLRDWEQSVQVERKWKCECHISHCMPAEKRSDTPLMTTNSGLESSKVPGIMKGSLKNVTGGVNKKQVQEQATVKQRIEILNWYHKNGQKQLLKAQHFDKIYPELCLKQPLICSWVKDEAKWHAGYAAEDGVAHSAKWACKTCHPEVTEMMDLWVVQRWCVAHWRSSSPEMASFCRYGGCTRGWATGPEWWVVELIQKLNRPEADETAWQSWFCKTRGCETGAALNSRTHPPIWLCTTGYIQHGWD